MDRDVSSFDDPAWGVNPPFNAYHHLNGVDADNMPDDYRWVNKHPWDAVLLMCGRHQKFEARVVAFTKLNPEIKYELEWWHVDFNHIAQRYNTPFNPDVDVGEKWFGYADGGFNNVWTSGKKNFHGHLYLPTIHPLAPIQPSHLMKSDPKFALYTTISLEMGRYRMIQNPFHDGINHSVRPYGRKLFDHTEEVPSGSAFSRYGQDYDFGEPKEGYGYAFQVKCVPPYSSKSPTFDCKFKVRVEHECIDLETPEPALPVQPPAGPLPLTKFGMQRDVLFFDDYWKLDAPFKPYMIIRPNENGPEYPFVHVCAPGETLSVPVAALAKKHQDDKLRMTWYQPNVDWLAKNYWASPFKDHKYFRGDRNNYKLEFPIIQVAAYYGDDVMDDCPQDYDKDPHNSPLTVVQKDAGVPYQGFGSRVCNRRNAPPTLGDEPVATSAKLLNDPNYMRMDRYLVTPMGNDYRSPRRKYNIQGVLPEKDKLWSEEVTSSFTRFSQGYEFPVQQRGQGYALAIDCFSPKYKADTGNQRPGCEAMLRIEAECVKPSGSGEKKAEL